MQRGYNNDFSCTYGFSTIVNEVPLFQFHKKTSNIICIHIFVLIFIFYRTLTYINVVSYNVDGDTS